MNKYVMLTDSKIEPLAKSGTIVYELAKHDYGLANMDSRMTGVEHISVTLNEDGDYPYFTCPTSSLKKVIE